MTPVEVYQSSEGLIIEAVQDINMRPGDRIVYPNDQIHDVSLYDTYMVDRIIATRTDERKTQRRITILVSLIITLAIASLGIGFLADQ